MRDLSVKTLLVFMLLFSSIENVLYVSGEPHNHGNDVMHVAHQDGGDSQLTMDDHEHCSSCCFGHLACHENHFPALDSDLAPSEPFAMLNRSLIHFAQAPPTPPPNA